MAFAAIILTLVSPSHAAQDLFVLQLSVQSGGDQRTAQDTRRPVLTVKPNARPRVKWSAVNQQKSGTLRDVTMHLVVDKENTVGQREQPKPGPDVVYESALVMYFAPQAKSEADFTLDAPQPGAYLLRLETIGAAATHGHEHVVAIDLQVQP